MMMVDVGFRLSGGPIAVDHGYHLFAALAREVPEVHGDEDVGVLPILGKHTGGRKMDLTERSRLVIRLPEQRIPQVLPLAGKTLEVFGGRLRVGMATTDGLVPASRLFSRLVVIKGYMEHEAFLGAVREQIAAMGVRGVPSLVKTPGDVRANNGHSAGTKCPYVRRTIRIREKEVVGFALRVEELSAEESILVQERGIGGRRRFGCGIFLPDRR